MKHKYLYCTERERERKQHMDSWDKGFQLNMSIKSAYFLPFRSLTFSPLKPMHLPKTWCSRIRQRVWCRCLRTLIPSCIWELNTWESSAPSRKVLWADKHIQTSIKHQIKTFTGRLTLADGHVSLHLSRADRSHFILCHQMVRCGRHRDTKVRRMGHQQHDWERRHHGMSECCHSWRVP